MHVCSQSAVFNNLNVTQFVEKVLILVLDDEFTLVTTLIATFVLFFPLIEAHKLCYKLYGPQISCIWMDVRVLAHGFLRYF